MIRIVNTWILLIGFHTLSFGQIKWGGIIIDQTTKQPIPYTNVGFFEKGVGTVSNNEGRFELIIPKELMNEDITFYHMGYEKLMLKSSFSENSTIELIPTAVALKEVAIVATDEINIGFKPTDNKVTGFFKAEGLGMEGGTLVNSEGTFLLTEFYLNVLKIPFDSLRFRLNFYTVKRHKPFERINSKDILFTLTNSDIGNFSVPVSSDNIQVTNQFICTIELVELYGKEVENAEFLFSAIPNSEGEIFKRGISLGKWERIKNYSLCFWFDGKRVDTKD